MSTAAVPIPKAAGRVLVRGSARHRLLVGAVAAIAAVVGILVPVVVTDFELGRLSQVAAYAVALLGLNIVTGMSGQISLGHAAFFGVGAYTTAILAGDHGWPFFATIPVSAAIGALVGLVVGIPALRLKGMYLAIVTLALGTAVPIYLQGHSSAWLGAGSASGVRASFRWTKPDWLLLDVSAAGWKYLVLLAIAVVVFLLVAQVLRSRVGRGLLYISSGERTAAVSGVWTAGTKIGAFVVSSMLAAVGGSMYMLVVPIVTPQSIGFSLTLLFLTAMIIGGKSSVAGAVVGAFFMVYLPPMSSQLVLGIPGLQSLTAHVGLVSNIVYGALLLLCVFFLPRGVVPAAARLARRFVVVIPAGGELPAASGARTRRPAPPAPDADAAPRTPEEIHS